MREKPQRGLPQSRCFSTTSLTIGRKKTVLPLETTLILRQEPIEMSAGQTGVPVLSIVIHPLQPRGRGRGDRPLADPGFGCTLNQESGIHRS